MQCCNQIIWAIYYKPEFYGLLNHHLGWPRRFGRYKSPFDAKLALFRSGMLVNFHSELRATPSSETILQTPRCRKMLWRQYQDLCGGIGSIYILYTSSQKLSTLSLEISTHLYNRNFQRSLLLPHLCFYNPYAAIFPQHCSTITWPGIFVSTCVQCHYYATYGCLAGTKACHSNVWHRKLNLLGLMLLMKVPWHKSVKEVQHDTIKSVVLQGPSKRQTIACLQ